MAITSDEYAILWSGRGLTRYRCSILDERLEQTFRRVDQQAGLPKQGYLQLGSKSPVAFNVNYDRAKVALLCDRLKACGASKAKGVADGLSGEMFTKKAGLRQVGRHTLWQLAELRVAGNHVARDEARVISRELSRGYVPQKSDFIEPEPQPNRS